MVLYPKQNLDCFLCCDAGRERDADGDGEQGRSHVIADDSYCFTTGTSGQQGHEGELQKTVPFIGVVLSDTGVFSIAACSNGTLYLSQSSSARTTELSWDMP